ncbi:ABC transporter permease [Desulfotomaculum copahuensis]|nr:ABC transporter permease subunit [Desulfotomaculum copahuensis]
MEKKDFWAPEKTAEAAWPVVAGTAGDESNGREFPARENVSLPGKKKELPEARACAGKTGDDAATGRTKRFSLTAGWREYWSGLRNGLTPVLGKEMRRRTRGWRSPLLLSIYLGLFSVGMITFFWFNPDRNSVILPANRLNLYGIFVFGPVMLLSFTAPALTAGAISGERERGTFDLLLVTRASLTGIVLGKWLASTACQLFLVLAALPLLAVVFLFGGVPLADMAMLLAICLVTGFGYSAFGLVLSAVFRRSRAATIVSLVLVFALLFGTLVVAGVAAAGWQRSVPTEPAPVVNVAQAPWYVYLSPLTALTSVMPAVEGPGMYLGRGLPVTGTVVNELMRRLRPGVQAPGAYNGPYPGAYVSGGIAPAKPHGLAAWAPLARFALDQGIMAVLCLAAAIVIIAPRKPWTVWLAKRRARKAAWKS